MNYSIIKFMDKMPQIHPSVYIADGARIIGNTTIGEGSSIWFNACLRGDVNHILIGKKTNIQDNTVIHVTTNGNPTIIGDRVTIGHSVILHACTIHDESLIGMGAIVLDNVIVGKNCFVAAGAVLTPNKTFEEGSMIVGSPAICKRKLTQKELDYVRWSADHYAALAKNYTNYVK